MHKECQCGNPAVWESVPCNAEDHKDCTSHHFWCNRCVPRDCTFCNEMEPSLGKWQPCIEIAPIEDMEEILIEELEKVSPNDRIMILDDYGNHITELCSVMCLHNILKEKVLPSVTEIQDDSYATTSESCS